MLDCVTLPLTPEVVWGLIKGDFLFHCCNCIAVSQLTELLQLTDSFLRIETYTHNIRTEMEKGR